jgi:two-component system chemotaxis response regulator CheY
MNVKLKALVVDDSGVMRKMVMKNLTDAQLADFQFVEAVDGADALTKFDPNEFHIAFIDWNMPNMTGIDLVRKIRALDDVEHVGLVMVTSEKTMGKIQEALDEAGADAFISKPFTVEELQHKLKKVVEKVSVAALRRARQQREQGEQEEETASGGFFGKLFG